jgi:hypothetical protein
MAILAATLVSVSRQASGTVRRSTAAQRISDTSGRGIERVER